MRITTTITPDAAFPQLSPEDRLVMREVIDNWPSRVSMRLQLNKRRQLWAAFVVVKSDTYDVDPFLLLQFRSLIALSVLYVTREPVVATIGMCRRQSQATQLRAIVLHHCVVDDRALEEISMIPKLRIVNLLDCTVSSSGIGQIANMISLRSVALNGAAIDPTVLNRLCLLSGLRRLYIDGHIRVDGWVRRLAACGGLRVLGLYNHTVSEDDKSWLRSSLPNCDIRFESR